LKNDINIPSKRKKKKTERKQIFLLKVTDKKRMIRIRLSKVRIRGPDPRTGSVPKCHRSGTLVDSGRDNRKVTDVNSRREPATVETSVLVQARAGTQ
jgi:hypothetical protein